MNINRDALFRYVPESEPVENESSTLVCWIIRFTCDCITEQRIVCAVLSMHNINREASVRCVGATEEAFLTQINSVFTRRALLFQQTASIFTRKSWAPLSSAWNCLKFNSISNLVLDQLGILHEAIYCIMCFKLCVWLKTVEVKRLEEMCNWDTEF